MESRVRRVLEIPDVARHATAGTSTANFAVRMALHGVVLFGILVANLAAAPLMKWGYSSMQEAASWSFCYILAVEAIVLLLMGMSRVASSVFTDRVSGLLEMQRLAPIGHHFFPLGKLLGVPSQLYALVLTSLPISAVCILVGGVSPGEFFRGYATLFLCAPLYHVLLMEVSQRTGKKAADPSGSAVIAILVLAFGGWGVSNAPGCQVTMLLYPLLPLAHWGTKVATVGWMGIQWDPLLLTALLFPPAIALGLRIRTNQLFAHPGSPRPTALATLDACFKLVLLFGMAVQSFVYDPTRPFDPSAHASTNPAPEIFALLGGCFLLALAYAASPDGFHETLRLRALRRALARGSAWRERLRGPAVALVAPSLLILLGTGVLALARARSPGPPGTGVPAAVLYATLAVTSAYAFAGMIAFATSRAPVSGPSLARFVLLGVNVAGCIGGLLGMFIFKIPRPLVLLSESVAPLSLMVLGFIPAVREELFLPPEVFLGIACAVQIVLAVAGWAAVRTMRSRTLALEGERDREEAIA